jgi:peptidoglycan/xylan/chitin deacetylase (PgdA/CDA1 family)
LGAIRAFRRLHASELRILTYHNFTTDTSALKAHCEHIRRFYHPVSMAQVADALNHGEPLPKDAVAITVDDGYRDFLYAHAVFEQFDLPSTVFLITDFLDGKSWPWWNQIQYALEQSRPRGSCELKLAGETMQVDLSSADTRENAAEVIAEKLKLLRNEQRLSEMTKLFSSLQVQIPCRPPERWQPLTWEEVRQLSRNRVEFGAHTKSHPILSSVLSETQLRDEIEGSKTHIEQQLTAPVRHFCYPNGRHIDVSREALAMTRNSGFNTAVTTEAGMNRLGSHTDPFRLKRLAVNADYPVFYFAEFLAGVRSS